MPIPVLPVPLVEDTDAFADDVMADFNELVRVLDPVSGDGLDGDNFPPDTPAGIWICAASGKPRFKVFTGDVLVDQNGLAALQPGTVGIPELVSLPFVELTKSGPQTIGSGFGGTMVAFETEIADTDGMHTGSGSKIIVVTPGVYAFAATVPWTNTIAAGNALGAQLLKNTTGLLDKSAYVSGGTDDVQAHSLSAVTKLAIGDFIEVSVFQHSGSDKIISPGCRFSAQWIGKG